jgi:phosphoribosylanthranilate isomerase
MFRIKICGITSYNDARTAIDAGADALGFNFYRASKRYVAPHDARAIAERLPTGMKKVGVFVNSEASEIKEIVEQVGIECVQLHGDEPAELLEQMPDGLPIIRAHRCGSSGLRPLADYLEECVALQRPAAAVLLDSDTAGAFGGTGRKLDWPSLANARSELGGVRLILAGGLSPQNVAAAIGIVQPDGVDVASGVERAPGVKDPALVAMFVAEAHQALGRLYQL